MKRNVTSRQTSPASTAGHVEREALSIAGRAYAEHPDDGHPADDEPDEVRDREAPEAPLEAGEEAVHAPAAE